MSRLPAPIVTTNSYVVLLQSQWQSVVDRGGFVPVTTYATVWDETYSRHVITIETIGM